MNETCIHTNKPKNHQTKGEKEGSSKVKKLKGEKERKQRKKTLKTKWKDKRKKVRNEEKTEKVMARKLHKYPTPHSGISWQYFCAAQNYLQVNAEMCIVVHKVTLKGGMDSPFQLKCTLHCMI